MLFDFAPDEKFNFLEAFAKRVGVSIQDATLALPAFLGEGSIKRMRQGEDFSLLIHHYILREELMLRRTAAAHAGERINVLFHINALPQLLPAVDEHSPSAREDVFAIRITSTNIDSQIRFPARSEVYFVVLSTTRTALRKMLNIKKMNRVVEQILLGQQGFLFYENMSAEGQKTLKTLVALDTKKELSELRIWIKVQELLCGLFERLLARETVRHSPIHQSDAHQLLLVRLAVVSDLSVPPQLPKLAQLAGMSTSKLTDLYKQVFGDSIYNYYQKARMEAAGHLLRDKGYSVAETGHWLGFSNLSHFGRLFEKHYGIKPKRFASGH